MRERTGILLLDKPVGPTSRELADDLEKRLMVGSIGHAGTLDPLASGILIALCGRARRLQEFFIDREKAYVARIRFGETSPTFDAEGPVTPTGVTPEKITPDAAREVLARFEGTIAQAPPTFSALRIDGKRAHTLARDGRTVALEPRRVSIRQIVLQAIENDDWIIEVTCGPGVYIRSLARDLGVARGCGAYLTALRRTRSGSLRVEDAVPAADAGLDHIRPLSDVLAGEPRIEVTKAEALRLFRGNVIERELGDVQPRFAWFGGRPRFKLFSPAPGLIRSDLLMEDLSA